MSEGIEYAEMLEIPVTTVNVVQKKKHRFYDLKSLAVGKVNRRVESRGMEQRDDNFAGDAPSASAETELDEGEDFVETTGNRAPMSEFFDRFRNFKLPKIEWSEQNVLIGEFAAACGICAVIFLTNVFMSNSAINVFLRSIVGGNSTPAGEVKTYADFTLSPVVSEYAEVTTTVSSTGVLSFTAKCSVYPACDGKVKSITGSEGNYTIEVSHSDAFSSVYSGLTNVYYSVGDAVAANVPFAYSAGESAVNVSFYQDGELLNCYSVDAQNCLSWNK